MIALKKVIFFAGITLAVLDGLAPCAYARSGPADLPPDVTAFVGRRSSCLEWSQKAIDPERKSQLDSIISIMRSLKCGDIANEERSLRQTYASNPDVLAALDATWTKVVKRLPVRITLPSDLDH